MDCSFLFIFAFVYQPTQAIRSLTVLAVSIALSGIFTPNVFSISDATLIRSSELRPISVLKVRLLGDFGRVDIDIFADYFGNLFKHNCLSF